MSRHSHAARDFAAIGETFNDATTQLVGGVSADNQARVLADLQAVQNDLAKLLVQQPGAFTGETAIHAQNIVDQLNLEIGAVKSAGTDPYAAKYINDVQRDLLDIVNGDDNLVALATQHGAHGFAAVPDLLIKPAPFQGNAEQTAFMKQFVADATDLGAQAVDLAVTDKVGPNDPQTLALEHKIQDFATQVDAFTKAQGGLYSARFDNEFAHDGVNGTATRALVDALAAGDGAKVQAAANVLAANAGDVASNMLGIGATPAPAGPGIPDHIDSFAVAGTVFNDATSRLIGGVYDGLHNDGNRATILADLTATQKGVQGLLADNQFQGRAAHDAGAIVKLLGAEITAVQTAGGALNANETVNDLHRAILGIVKHDGALMAAASVGDVQGFSPLPKAARPAGPISDVMAHHDGHGHHHGGAGAAIEVAAEPSPMLADHSHMWG